MVIRLGNRLAFVFEVRMFKTIKTIRIKKSKRYKINTFLDSAVRYKSIIKK